MKLTKREGPRNRFQKPISRKQLLRTNGQAYTVTFFLQDILRQPAELQRTIDFLRGAGQRRLVEAAAAVKSARHVYLTGIGSSWHAALTAGPMFSLGGRPVYMQDASELLQFAALPAGAVIIVISRTGRRLPCKSMHCG